MCTLSLCARIEEDSSAFAEKPNTNLLPFLFFKYFLFAVFFFNLYFFS